jgi:hypothetical protein
MKRMSIRCMITLLVLSGCHAAPRAAVEAPPGDPGADPGAGLAPADDDTIKIPQSDWYGGCDISVGPKDDSFGPGLNEEWVAVGFTPTAGVAASEATLHFNGGWDLDETLTTMRIEYQAGADPDTFEVLDDDWRIERDDRYSNNSWDKLIITGFDSTDGRFDLALRDAEPGRSTVVKRFRGFAPTGTSAEIEPVLEQVGGTGTYAVIAFRYRGRTFNFRLSRP